MRIGILGGTFDPIHLGHLYLARKVLQKLSLEKIIFIPAYIPPHKKNSEVTSTRHRYNMVKLAIAGNKRFEASGIEIERKGSSYSVETMRQLRNQYGPSVKIFFITGSDSLKELSGWKNLEEMLTLCKFVVVKRPRFMMKNVPEDFMLLSINAKDISSTVIRKRIEKGSSITKLVPKKVRDYIKRHKLHIKNSPKYP
jgi:nicotinate-nucleotide adenylyltransferase